ncbi:unnamed protein product, partial [Closterium sp. Naga37s-1]
DFANRRYLVFAAVEEQLTNAKIHVIEAARVARETNRILVLPKGSRSHLSLGRSMPMCAYCDLAHLNATEWVSPEFFLLLARAAFVKPTVSYLCVDTPELGRPCFGTTEIAGSLGAVFTLAMGHVPTGANTIWLHMPARFDQIQSLLNAWKHRDVVIYAKNTYERFDRETDDMAHVLLPYAREWHLAAKRIVARLPEPFIGVHYRSEFIAFRLAAVALQSNGSVRAERISSAAALFPSRVAGLSASSPVSRSASTSRRGVVRRANAVTPRASAEAEEPVTIDNSNVLVVGGGGVGMEVVRQLAKAGSWVTALQRGEKFRKEIEGLGAMLAIGDVMAPGTIEKALRGNTFDAVVSTVGGGLTDIKVDSDGNINVIAAAEKAGVPRFVLVSSIGAGDSKAAVPGKEMDVLGPVLAEKEKSEERLKASDKLKWTIVRPGGLLSDAASGSGILTEDSSVVGVISRADVAQLILRILFQEKAEGKVFSAIDAQKKFPGAPEKEIVEFKV